MIVGLGLDTVGVDRFEPWVNDARKIARFFHPLEAAYIERMMPRRRATSLAVRFAAKEAWGKATGRGLRGVRLIDIAVGSGADGKPHLRLFNSAQEMVENIDMLHIHLTLTHTARYATACVIIEK